MSKIARAVCLAFVLGCGCTAFADDATEAGKVLKHRVVSIEVSIVELSEAPQTDETLDGKSSQKLIDRIRELEAQGKLAGLTRLRLSTLENNITSAQTSERTPVATARGGFGGQPGREGGPVVQTCQNRDFGTMVTVIPRIEPGDTIVMELQVEKSSPVRDTPAAGSDRLPAPTRTATLNFKSTLRVPNGQTVIAQSSGTLAGDMKSRTVILLTARAEQAPAAATAAKLPAAQELKIFHLTAASADGLAEVLQNLFSNRPIKFAAEPRTNSLLIQGLPEDLQILEAIISKLDQPPARKLDDRK